MNVGLTAINVLWNAADLLAKRSVHSLHSKAAEVGSSLPNGTADHLQSDLLDNQQFEDLLRVLFQAIQVNSHKYGLSGSFYASKPVWTWTRLQRLIASNHHHQLLIQVITNDP